MEVIVEAARVVTVEAPEVNQLASSVNLGLECRLRLVQHGCGVDSHAPVACEKVGAALKHRAASLETDVDPVLLSLHCRIAGGLHFGSSR